MNEDREKHGEKFFNFFDELLKTEFDVSGDGSLTQN